MVYKWYFHSQLGDGLCHRSHLLGEPERTIDLVHPSGDKWLTMVSCHPLRIGLFSDPDPFQASTGPSHFCRCWKPGVSQRREICHFLKKNKGGSLNLQGKSIEISIYIFMCIYIYICPKSIYIYRCCNPICILSFYLYF